MTKVCIECKYHQRYIYNIPDCMSPVTRGERHIVTGRYDFPTCNFNRFGNKDEDGPCGLDGKLWEKE